MALTHADAAPRPVALLVGVGDYQDPKMRDLEGPPYDVAALRGVLIEKWGFRAEEVRTLVDKEATRQRILEEMDRLSSRSKPGDAVFIYFSGHGTSQRDRNHSLPLPHSSGAFVPYDLRLEGDVRQLLDGLIIGARDIRPRLSALERAGRSILVASDSCYSGQAVRSLGGLPSRHVDLPLRGDGRDEIESSPDMGNRPEAPPYPYGNVVYLAAASDNEKAADIGTPMLARVPTLDGKPHGAFSDALLRVLNGDLAADVNRDQRLNHGEVFEAVARFMDGRGFGHHPQMLPSAREDSHGLAQRTLFTPGGAAANAAPAPLPTPGSPGPAADALSVTLEGAAVALKPLLEGISGVQIVAGNGRFRVQAGKGQGDDWLLLSGNGDLLAQGGGADIASRLRAEAWLQDLLARADRKRRFNLSLEVDPATRGGNFIEGETLAFSLRSEKPGRLLLLDMDASGRVSVLYPTRAEEMQPLAGGRNLMIPGNGPKDRIRVTPPFGTDRLLALVFATDQPLLGGLMNRQGLGTNDPLLERLAHLLDSGTEFAATPYSLRALPKDAAGDGHGR